MLRDIKIGLGLEQPSTMDRVVEGSGMGSRSSSSTVDRFKQALGLQEKSELQELQESLCPALTYEQVRARPTPPFLPAQTP